MEYKDQFFVKFEEFTYNKSNKFKYRGQKPVFKILNCKINENICVKKNEYF